MLEHTNIHIGRVMAETSKLREGDSVVVSCVGSTSAGGTTTPLYDLRVCRSRLGERTRECAECGRPFVGKIERATFCGATCRSNAHRKAKRNQGASDV